MPKYEVTLKEIEIYVVNVEAEDEDEAVTKAWVTLHEQGKNSFYSDSDSEAIVVDSDE